MIEVSVRQDHGVNRVRGHRQVLPVPQSPFFLSLEEATIHEYLQRSRAVVVDMNQVLRAGNHSGRAEKLNVAQAVLIRTNTSQHCREAATQDDNSVSKKAVHHRGTEDT